MKDIKMYFDVGAPGPAGFRDMAAKGVLLTPKFVGLLTKTGSPGGSTIVLNVQGIGRNDTVKRIQYESPTAGTYWTLCDNPTTIGYGRISCLTKAIVLQKTKLRVQSADG
jgi:hypothetical protein